MYHLTGWNFAATAVGVILGLSSAIVEADSTQGRISRPDSTPDNARRAKSGSPTGSTALPRPSRSITPPKGTKKSRRGSGSTLQTIGALLFIVTLIVVGARLLRKHTPRLNGGIPTEAMEVLGKRAVDQRQVVHLIRLGSRILVLGGSPQGLQTLAEITDPVEVDYLAGMCRRDDTESRFTQGFLSLFRRQPATEPHDGAHAQTEPPSEDSYAESGHAAYSSVDGAALADRLNDTELAAAENRHA